MAMSSQKSSCMLPLPLTSLNPNSRDGGGVSMSDSILRQGSTGQGSKVMNKNMCFQ